MEAERTSETSVDIDLTTQQYTPEYSELQLIETLWQIYYAYITYLPVAIHGNGMT
jgi:hypothetical protein